MLLLSASSLNLSIAGKFSQDELALHHRYVIMQYLGQYLPHMESLPYMESIPFWVVHERGSWNYNIRFSEKETFRNFNVSVDQHTIKKVAVEDSIHSYDLVEDSPKNNGFLEFDSGSAFLETDVAHMSNKFGKDWLLGFSISGWTYLNYYRLDDDLKNSFPIDSHVVRSESAGNYAAFHVKNQGILVLDSFKGKISHHIPIHRTPWYTRDVRYNVSFDTLISVVGMFDTSINQYYCEMPYLTKEPAFFNGRYHHNNLFDHISKLCGESCPLGMYAMFIEERSRGRNKRLWVCTNAGENSEYTVWVRSRRSIAGHMYDYVFLNGRNNRKGKRSATRLPDGIKKIDVGWHFLAATVQVKGNTHHTTWFDTNSGAREQIITKTIK